MEEQETPKDKAPSKEDRLKRYLESEIDFDADRSVQHKRMSVEGCIVGAAWLIGKSVERQESVLADTKKVLDQQEEINREILSESRAVKRLTIAVVVLTAAVVVLTIALLAKG